MSLQFTPRSRGVFLCYTYFMREIEVKAKVENKEDLLKRAKNLDILFSDTKSQEDKTYETDIPYEDPDWNIFRIRKQGDKTILTMKYKASTRSRDNHERETVIEDPEEMAGILERLGYKFGVRIHKHRQTAKYKDLEICLDELDDLGTFIEVEKLASDDVDVDKIQDELWKILLQLGINPEDRVHKGYDTLMHEFIRNNK